VINITPNQSLARVETLLSPLAEKLKPFAAKLVGPQSIGWLALSTPQKLNLLFIESLLNHFMRDLLMEGEFEFLQDHKLAIHLIDTGVYCQIGYHLGRLRALSLTATEPENDVLLAVNVADAINLIQQKVDPDTLFFRRRLKISGSTELAHQVKNTIDNLDPSILPNLVHSLLDAYQSLIAEKTGAH